MIYHVLDTRSEIGLPDRKVIDCLHPERRLKASCFHALSDTLSSIAVWTLLQVAIDNEYPDIFGFDINHEELEYDICGKPYFLKRPKIQFSLSHSGEAIMCALADEPVGCDIELKERFVDIGDSFKSHVLHQNEIKFIQNLTSDEMARAICILWTMKESYTKKRGVGLSETFSLIDFSTQIGRCLVEGSGSSTAVTFGLFGHEFTWYEKEGFSLCACGNRRLTVFGDCGTELQIQWHGSSKACQRRN